MSRNGKLLYDLVQKYNLYLLNSSNVCSGVFTRTRQCNGKQEISVLDYVFVTSDIYEQVRSMEIDEKNFFTAWRKLGKGRRFSDHHAIKLSLNLEFSKSPKRAKKLVVWHFDDPLNWKSFHQRTRISDDLQKKHGKPKIVWKLVTNNGNTHSILYCMSASPKRSLYLINRFITRKSGRISRTGKNLRKSSVDMISVKAGISI